MINIKKLIFEGGGVKGIAYAGALKALEEEGVHLSDIVGTAGTSVGSIVATMIALGYTSDELRDWLYGVNFSKFDDGNDLIGVTYGFFLKYGIHDGEVLFSTIKGIISKKGFSPDIDFEALHKATGKDLKMFAVDLNIAWVKEFSFKTTPKVIVAEAIRASISIPLYYRAWQFSNHIPDNHLYVDGGVMYNYPIYAFDDENVNDEKTGVEVGGNVLGFTLVVKEEGVKEIYSDIPDIGVYAKALFASITRSKSYEISVSHEEKIETVKIDSLGIAATKFNITKQEMESLYNSGYQATKAYFATIKS